MMVEDRLEVLGVEMPTASISMPSGAGEKRSEIRTRDICDQRLGLVERWNWPPQPRLVEQSVSAFADSVIGIVDNVPSGLGSGITPLRDKRYLH